MRTAIILLLGLCACDPRVRVVYRPVCDLATTQQRSDFILTCAKNANPLSDEEGEDLVKQCQDTAESTFCPVAPHACYQYVCTPCDKATDGYRKSVCDGAK